jgi:phosphoglycolate phosphatase-like HAD superfamily hydrolase
MKLVVFDLDQTLVDAIEVHDRSTQQLFERIYGVDARLTEIDFAGRSLVENFKELARTRGLPENKIEENREEVLAWYEDAFSANLALDGADHVLPGVKELLDALYRDDCIIALYTGDSPGVGERMLAAADLDEHFQVTVYGTEAPTRADMIRLAIDRGEKLTGQKFSARDVVIIGDSVRDVQAGREIGVVTIAVVTGFHSRDELADAGPDYLFEDLSSCRDVLRAIRAS